MKKILFIIILLLTFTLSYGENLKKEMFMRNSMLYSSVVFNPNSPNHLPENRQFNAMASVAVTKGGRIYVACETGGNTEP